MKKIIISLIVIVSLILITFLGWYFLGRDEGSPVGEVIRGVLPFGSEEDVTRMTIDDEQTSTDLLETFDENGVLVSEPGAPTAALFSVSDTPVAGMVVLNKGTSTVVRYVDRATGHIYDADLETLDKTKITNQTMPKIYEAYFRADGRSVLVRFLKDNSDVVENFTLTLTPPETEGDLYIISSTALRGDIDAVAVGSGNNLFYTLRDISSIVSSAFNGAGIKTLFTSPFTDWRLSTAGNSLVIYTKASANAGGYAYTLSASGGTLTKILGPLNGLVVAPNTSGSRMLYSYVENTKTKLFIINLTNNTSYEIAPATLAEKCVWGRKSPALVFCGSPSKEIGANEPDNWYKGATSFSDRIWLFDISTETAQVLAEPTEVFGVDIDVVEPKLSLNEDYLVFINKIDLSLWALKLE